MPWTAVPYPKILRLRCTVVRGNSVIFANLCEDILPSEEEGLLIIVCLSVRGHEGEAFPQPCHSSLALTIYLTYLHIKMIDWMYKKYKSKILCVAAPKDNVGERREEGKKTIENFTILHP